MIHVCFGLHDKNGRYSKFTGTAILSIFENTNYEVTVHILHDNTLTQDNRDKFLSLTQRYGQNINFYNIEEICKKKIEKIKEKFPKINSARVSIGAFYRLFITEVISKEIGQVIYLDSDIIVNLDINDLWQVELDNKPLAAVPEYEADYVFFKSISQLHYLLNEEIVEYENYFNSAVMLMNLNKLRNESKTLINGLEWRAKHPQCICFDQDILNYSFAKDYVHLSNRFDRFVTSERAENQPVQNVIYHFTGRNPTADFSDELNRLYFDYFAKTPWFTIESVGRIFNEVQHFCNQLKNGMIKLSVLFSKKKRAFFVSSTALEFVSKIFYINDDDEVIIANEKGAFKKMAESLIGRKKFFLIFSSNVINICTTLTKIGFKDGEDFMDGMELLSGDYGNEMDMYPLIKAM